MEKNQCPVCNGLNALTLNCPNCRNLLTDCGRYMDQFGDYSPYRSIDELKRTDEIIDLRTHQCPHQVTCSQCSYSTIFLISES